jgi:hypothetical protein
VDAYSVFPATQGAPVGKVKFVVTNTGTIEHEFVVLKTAKPAGNLLKGKEVFSNIGQVAPSSTLLRFISAKDDNDQKQLIWGVQTDASGILHISLRDFRSHVASLHAIERQDLANTIAQDYLDAYVSGINAFIRDLWRITQASRETRTRSELEK